MSVWMTRALRLALDEVRLHRARRQRRASPSVGSLVNEALAELVRVELGGEGGPSTDGQQSEGEAAPRREVT